MNSKMLLSTALLLSLTTTNAVGTTFLNHKQTLAQQTGITGSFNSGAANGKVDVYSNFNFDKKLFTLGPAEATYNAPDGTNPGISALKLGAATRMKICKSLNCANESQIDDAAEVVGPYTINKLEFYTLNDLVLSIQLYNYDETDLDQARVTLFGRHSYALPYAGTFLVGDYNLADL